MASDNLLTPITIMLTDDELEGIVYLLPEGMDVEDFIKIILLGEIGKRLLETD